MRLAWSEYRELNSILEQQIDVFPVHGSFRKPILLDRAQSGSEVANAPANLVSLYRGDSPVA